MKTTIAVFLIVWDLAAAEKWTRATSQNFEVYSEGGASSAKDLLSRFEIMRSIFVTRTQGVVTSPIPVRVFVFTDPKEFLRYGQKSSGGFYQPYPERDLIALNGLSTNDYGPAMRNVVYASLRHFGRPLPRWLQSGMAEFYSSVKIVGLQATIGAPVVSYVHFLSQHGVMDLKTFLDAQQRLYESTDADARERFFAQSWAITHLLYVSEKYRDSTTAFLTEVEGGLTPEDAFHKVYDRSLAEVGSDLDSHLRRLLFTGVRFDIERPDAVDKAAQHLTADEADFALAELLGAVNGREAEARQRYDELARRLPTDPRTHVGIAYIALRQRSPADARRELELAFAMGYNSGSSHYTYAALIRAADANKAQEHLQLAVSLNPSHFDAWRMLADIAASQGRQEAAIGYLRAVIKLKPADASAWVAAAQAYDASGHLEDDRLAAKTAREVAVTATEKRMVEQIEQRLGTMSPRNNPH